MFSTTLQFGVTSLFRGSYVTWCTLDYCISPCIALRYDLLLAPRFAQGVSTPASGPRTPRTSSDPQTPPLRKQQQQQQSRQGGGRDDGGRSSRVGSMLAVERQAVMPGEGLVESMDVFSLGCVIAEIFLGSDPLLDLPGLVRYRISGEDMGARLKRLEAAGGPVVLRLVEHMVQRDASKRKTVQEYIQRMEKPRMLFPRSFGSFLFPLLATMHARQSAGDLDLDPRGSHRENEVGSVAA
ncbi:unnamed protein product [Ascophyllum nodosum]